MKKLAKVLSIAALCAFTAFAVGCGGDKKTEKKADTNAPIKIGVTAGPHAEIMDNVKKLADKKGLKIEVVEFSDYVTPNVALAQGELFANSMQHAPYLKATLAKEPSFKLVEVFKTVNFPMAVYSQKVKKGEEIPEGAIVGIPNDPSNGGRALLLLADKGLIQIKDKTNVVTSMKDVTANPKNLVIRELDAAIIPNSLPDLTVAVINCNYALPAGLNPTNDSILLENADNPFLNIFVTREANVNDPRIKQLQEVYQSAENKEFVNEYFKGTITPAW